MWKDRKEKTKKERFKMEKWRQKLIEGLFLLLGLSTLFLGMEYIKRQQMQQEIAEKVVRFHVIANSDT